MKYIKCGLILLIMVTSMTSYALTSKLKDLSTQQILTKYPWTIGFGVSFSPKTYKDTKGSRYGAFPVIGYNGDRFSFSGPSFSYKVVKNKWYSLAVQGQLYPQEFSPKDSSDPKLKKLNTRHYTIMAGVNGTLYINRFESVNLSVLRSVIGAKSGYMIDGQYQLTLPVLFKTGTLLINPGVGVQWSSAKLVNYYYGIDNSEATKSGLSAYHPKSALSPYLALSFTYIYEKRWSATLGLKASRLPSAIANSPMTYKRRIKTSASLVLSHSF